MVSTVARNGALSLLVWVSLLKYILKTACPPYARLDLLNVPDANANAKH